MKITFTHTIKFIALLIVLAGVFHKTSAQKYSQFDSVLYAVYADSLSLKKGKQCRMDSQKKGKEADKKIQAYIGKEKYREALSVFEQYKGEILMYQGHSDCFIPFFESMIELYYKVFDEDEARKKAIDLREFGRVYMEEIIAGGRIPKNYFSNSCLLAYDYRMQKEYVKAIGVYECIRSVLKQFGDTTSVAYATALSNEGILFEDFFFDNIEILEEGIDDDAKSTLMEIGAVAIGVLRKANAILNTLPDMKYSVDNVKILFRLLYIYEARDVDVEVVIACIEEIKEIYEVNEWEVDSRYGLARTRLLIGYIQAGEMQKAEELYALIKSQSTGECPSFEEIVRQMAK